jgi:hypothetical protein
MSEKRAKKLNEKVRELFNEFNQDGDSIIIIASVESSEDKKALMSCCKGTGGDITGSIVKAMEGETGLQTACRIALDIIDEEEEEEDKIINELVNLLKKSRR